MSLTSCRTCGGVVATSAPACPHCGDRLKRPAGHLPGWLIIPALIFPVWCVGRMDSSTPVDPTVSVRAGCHVLIRGQLKAPKDADLQSELRGNKVVGVVDAENSFGARLRRAFECEVRNGQIVSALIHEP